LRSTDVVVSPLPWSPLLDWMQTRPIEKRPYIIRVADGLITPINSRKPINNRDGGLYANRNGDVFVVKQNRADLDHLRREDYPAASVREFDVEKITLKSDEIRSVILVFGNDPSLGISREKIMEEVYTLIAKCREIGIANFSVACPDSKFRKKIQKAFPELKLRKFISELNPPVSGTLIFSTPSTVALDYMISGYAVMGFSSFSDPVLLRYFLSTKEFLSIKQGQGIYVNRIRTMLSNRIDLGDIVSMQRSFPKTRSSK